ncbi:restriction endonuclease subunit S [Acinetobacter gandensis]|uniref:restriction endonuclease subunit S n=1 Tax=Acinetobacter gandensis TaxID=1443941 RepID=UPI00398A4F50
MAAPKLRFKEFDGDWSAQKYKDALTIKYGKDHKLLEDGEIPVYGTGGVMRYVNQYLYDGESILIGRKGTIDQPKYVNEKFWTVDTLFYSEIKQNIYPLFIYQHALQVNWLGLNEATGVPSLNTTSINNVDIYLPSKEEQTKIASFLSNVDEKISQLTQKHELLSQYKQGMMQKLFSQQVRFKADDGSEFGEWETLKFKYFIQERNQICSDATVELCSLTIEKGVTEKTERYTRDFLVKDEKNAYKEVHFNDFVMNPMNLRFGAIAKSNMDKIVKISKYYNVFNINQNIVNLDYFVYFSVSKPIIDFYNLMSTGSLIEKRRNHFKDFIQYEKSFPCLEEQTKIANFLSAINQKIEVVAQQIEQAKTWKKGLLQQMFV